MCHASELGSKDGTDPLPALKERCKEETDPFITVRLSEQPLGVMAAEGQQG